MKLEGERDERLSRVCLGLHFCLVVGQVKSEVANLGFGFRA